MADFYPENLTAKQSYELLVGSVVPRPIAWITTENSDGSINLAPFSCFTYIGGAPPQIVIAMGTRDGTVKDTLRNIERTKEFVTNSVSEESVPIAAQSSGDYPPNVSEAADLGVELIASLRVKPPKIEASRVSLECVLAKLVPVGDSDNHHLVIGRVLCFRISDEVLRDGRIDVHSFLPVGRLGGPFYVAPGKVIRADVDILRAARTE